MESELSNEELDLPPEYCNYQDEGCEFANSCLSCPFPQCIYEQPRGRQRWLKKLRDKEMIRLLTAGSGGVRELAVIFGVSQSSASAKSRMIMDMLNLVQLDPQWSLPSQLADNPMAWMIEVNGLILDARYAPRAIQEEAFRLGLIPFLPERRE